jgi:hypothetical protein
VGDLPLQHWKGALTIQLSLLAKLGLSGGLTWLLCTRARRTVILSCLRGALEPATKTVADAGAAAAHLVAEAMNDAAQLAAPASLAEVKHPEGGAIVPGSSLAIPSVAMQSAAATGVKALHGSAPSMARTGTAAAAAAAKLAASAL